MAPILELTFSDVAGDPWEGRGTVRFQGETSDAFPVREGLTTRQRGNLRWYIEDFMYYPEAGDAVKAAQIEQDLAAYGRALWDGLTNPVAQAWLGAVRAAGTGRLDLRAATRADEVAFRSPWELLRAAVRAAGDGQLLHQLGVTVVRRVHAEMPRLETPATADGLRVLAVVCRPSDTGFLDPRFTPEAILTALEARPEVSVEFCRPGTLAALVDALECARNDGRPFHVVHFDGHGTTLPMELGIGALCFETDDGVLDLVRAPQFGDLMARFNIPLVVLEACRTATKSFAQDTVAGALLRQGVATVLAMGHAVHVDMTRELMAGFYEGIARGWTLGVALQAARNRLYANMHRRTRIAADAPTVKLHDWFVPQLYQGGDDPRLLQEIPAKYPRKPRSTSPITPLFAGFPPEPRAGFQGRGYELHRLERTLLNHRVVVVHAPGGMGKTALAREAGRWWLRTGMFPDGAVFVSLEGNPSPERLVGLVGESLEGVEFHQRKNAATWLERQLTERRMLIVWDNFESVLPAFNAGRPMPPEFADLARRWTRGASRVLITCRDDQVGFDARPFPLGELSKPEGLMLLVGYLDRVQIDRPQREQRGWTAAVLEPIVERVGGHPLALELLAPQLAQLGPQRVLDEVSELLRRLRQEAPEGRNQSMWASLDFSIRHLSDPTRAVLPAVALLAGGCLENMAAMVVGLEADAWQQVRSELERTGLVRVENGFLRPHPVLGDMSFNRDPTGSASAWQSPAATASADQASSHALPVGSRLNEVAPDVFHRFLGIVQAFAAEFNKLVRTPNARAALAAMAGTEVVVRRAIEHAVQAGQLEAAVDMAGALRIFLELTGRGGEGAALITRLHDQVAGTHVGESLRDSHPVSERPGHVGHPAELTDAAAQLARQSAWAHAASNPAAAAAELQRLLAALKRVSSWDTRFQRANTLMTLGRVHYGIASRPADAIQPLQQAVELFAELEAAGETNTTNRAATLGDLANAFMALGRFDQALQAAEDGLTLNRQRNDQSAVARSEGRIAQILDAMGRQAEAEQRYRQALAASEAAGDDELAGILWQSLGNLAADRNRLDEAADSLRKGLAAFQRASDDQGQMQVLNSLGEVERLRGNPQAALSWYERSLELAQRLGSVQGQAAARSNRAILLSDQAQAAADPDTRRRLLSQAIAENRESLALKQQLGQPASIAISHNNLADDLRLAAECGIGFQPVDAAPRPDAGATALLDEAEHHAQQALAIWTQLNDPHTWQTLLLLEKIAAARGDAAAAAEYRRRKEAAHAEAQQRAGRAGLDPKMLVALLQLALAARAQQVPLADALRAAGADDPAALLDQLDQNDPWLTTHLRALAAHEPRPAAEVPAPYADLLAQVWQAAAD